MQFKKNTPLPIITCPTCGGTGVAGWYHCHTCIGMGMGRMSRGEWLYFGEPLTAYHITLRRARRWLDRFEFLGALIFGLGFLLLFFFFVLQQRSPEIIFTPAFWLKPKSAASEFFWMSMLGFSFVVYKVLSLDVAPRGLAPHGYDTAAPAAPADNPLFDWKQVRHIPHRKRRNIALAFTPEARRSIEAGYLLAMKYHNAAVDSLHIFLALLDIPSIRGIFIRLGIPVAKLTAHLTERVRRMEPGTSSPVLGPDVIQIFFQAYEAAWQAEQDFVAPTELLLAAVGQSEPIQELLYDLSIDQQKLANVVAWVRVREQLRQLYRLQRRAAAHRSKHGIDRAMTAVATPYLNSLSQDLTLAAKFGYLPPCVARDEEIQEIFRIIEGGRQNILLVGEPGVGKVSVIEGLVDRMIRDLGPKRLHDKRLVQLSSSALLAGTTVPGAQERLIHVMNEILRAKNIILFINNLHELMSIGNASGEGLDVSGTLAEYAGDANVLVFATTTPEGYAHHIATSQLGTIFARVEIKEMNDNQAIQVLESRVGGIEYKHNVFFSYDALSQAVGLARRFLHEQRLPESAIELITESAALTRNKKGQNQLVLADDVAAVVSQKTGVPATSVSNDEGAKLLHLEEAMHERVIGQAEAVSLVASALRRARAEIRSTNRPIANFLFLGPTGVGKTELAKTIAAVYFGGEKQMIRIDMSEFQDKQGVYRLIGQPGQAGSGLLTEAVRLHPFSLVLLDEMEKADPDILNLFLQVFDDGRLTDSVGRVIDFTNTIIIATSNAGTSFVQEQIQAGAALEQIRQQLVRSELKKYYRPEFLNRFDGIVLFAPLDRPAIKQVAGLMLKRVAKDLAERGVELRVEDVALEALADIGWDPEFGARPMRRAIQDTVENALADMVLKGELKRRDVVVLGEGGELRVERS